MVTRKYMKNKFVLISVHNKNKLKYLCDNLKNLDYKFISTGSTAKKIRSLGHVCKDLSKITRFKELLDGRVKTLNPKIHGSILYKRDDKKHISEFQKLKFPSIDIVVINLYPFEKYLKQNIEDKLIEMIDIGGSSLLRSSGKNYKFVTTISQVNDYEKLIKNLKINKGITDINFRKIMAAKAFEITAKYDSVISRWFSSNKKNDKIFKLRYGENPNQNSYIKKKYKKSILDHQISGKKLSYNNILDVDNGVNCLIEFSKPTCVIIKHNNPCGVASSKNIRNAFKKANASDRKSAFGGIVLLNKKIDQSFAKLLSKFFLEVIVSTGYDKNALKILKKNEQLILLKLDKNSLYNQEMRSTNFGILYQDKNQTKINKSFCKLVAHKDVSAKSLNDICFSLKVVKHLKSNAIVLSNNEQTLGIGNGQTNRIDALKIALEKYKRNFKKKKIVCASDGFFPFTDSLKLLNKNGCKIVVQPSGSINDNNNIKYAKKNKISLYFSKYRLFKH